MVKPKELFSAPVIISQPREYVVGAGSNISLSCSATGSGTLDIVWFQDQQNLNSTRQSNSALLDTPTSTLLLERRYEIAMDFEPPNTAHSSLFLYNLKLNDTGLFICSVKNEAGTSYTNHSLIVNDSPPARLRDLVADPNRRLWWWEALSQNSNTQLGLVALIFVIILLAAVILLLIFKNYSSRSGSSSSSDAVAKSSFLAFANLFGGSRGDQKQNKPSDLGHHHRKTTGDEDDDDDCSSSTSSSSCRKNANHNTTDNANLEGFIEHLRSGIINMDYQTMSPVVQFNNNTKQNSTTKNNYHHSPNNPNKSVHHHHHHQQQHQQPPHYFASVDEHHQMHHFPSASNTSSLPYYSQGSASMSTTLSNLNPASANMQTVYTGVHHHQANNIINNGPSIINCDMPHRLNGVDQMAPPTNTTTTSYTSDYQSGYGDASDQPMLAPNSNTTNMMMPPMYYETAPEQINYPSTNQLAAQPTSMLLNGAFPVAGVPTYLMLQQQQHHHQQPQPNQQLITMHANSNNRNTAAARMLANRALSQDQDLSSSRPSLTSGRQ